MKTPILLTCCLGVLLVSGHIACSQSTTYLDNRDDFLVATFSIPGNRQSISFADWRPLDFVPVLTISDVTFTGEFLSRSSIRPAGSPPEWPLQSALFNFDSGVPLGIHFSNGARAFGADFSSDVSMYFSSFTATVSLNTGERFTFTTPASPGSRFFGIISPTPFTDITFSDGGIFPIIPGVSLHEEKLGDLYMVLVPEPGSAVLLTLGTAALLWRRRTARHTS